MQQHASTGLHLDPIPREVDRIVRDVQSTRLFESGAPESAPALSDAQLFVARLHGFSSWPKLIEHIEARNRESSPISRFELAADATVGGDLEIAERENT